MREEMGEDGVKVVEMNDGLVVGWVKLHLFQPSHLSLNIHSIWVIIW